MSKKAPLTILILGLPDAGKTTIQFRLKFDEVCTTVPTDGFNFHDLQYKKSKIECWDYGGSKLVQEKLWPETIGKAQGIFWVVDAKDANRIKESVETLTSVISQLPSKIPICVLANKYDLDGAMDKTEMTAEFSKFPNAKVFHVCAMESKSLDAGFEWLVNEITGKSKDEKKKDKDAKKDKKDKKEKQKDKDNKKNIKVGTRKINDEHISYKD